MRERSEILVVDREQVPADHDGGRDALGRGNPRAQVIEARRAAVVEQADHAVEREGLDRELRERAHRRRERQRPVAKVGRGEPHRITDAGREHAMPVPRRLE
jgi:hypothetical protein